MPVAFRDDPGQPWCDDCRRRDEAQPCCGCGITKVVTAILMPAGLVLGLPATRSSRPHLRRLPTEPVHANAEPGRHTAPRLALQHRECSPQPLRGATLARAERRWPEGLVRLPCVDAVPFTHAACHRCGHPAAVFRQEEAGPLCPECAGANFAYRCPTCSAMGRLPHGQRPHCRAMQELAGTLAGPDGRRSAQLAPLAEVLEQYE
ncbi:hypothetical protein ADK38_14455, partial [Streptomyces varsoviensis]